MLEFTREIFDPHVETLQKKKIAYFMTVVRMLEKQSDIPSSRIGENIKVIGGQHSSLVVCRPLVKKSDDFKIF